MFECSPLNADSAVNTTDEARDRARQMPASRQSNVTLSRTGTGSGTVLTSAAAQAAKQQANHSAGGAENGAFGDEPAKQVPA